MSLIKDRYHQVCSEKFTLCKDSVKKDFYSSQAMAYQGVSVGTVLNWEQYLIPDMAQNCWVHGDDKKQSGLWSVS